MAFDIPTFNTAIGIWNGPWLSRTVRGLTACNLAFGRRVQQSWLSGGNWENAAGGFQMLLLLPYRTDIRSGLVQLHPDIVEVPALSGRWYQVIAVDDIGRGFPNEHRAAVIIGISQFTDPTEYAGLFWPVPIP
jgi:hypothetical protein